MKPYGYDEWLEEQLGEDYIEIEDYIDDPAICTAEYIPPGGGSSFNRDWLNNYVELMEAEDTDMSSYLHICPKLYVSRSYTVSITSNLEEMEPYGNGVYSEGSTVNVGFTRTGIELHLLPLAPPMFVRWSGDLISHKQERVSFIAT